jgi:hypothetical protein
MNRRRMKCGAYFAWHCKYRVLSTGFIEDRRFAMKRIILSVISGLVILLPSIGFAAQSTPVQVSLWNPVQIFPEDQDVSGLRLNILYGKN